MQYTSRWYQHWAGESVKHRVIGCVEEKIMLTFLAVIDRVIASAGSAGRLSNPPSKLRLVVPIF